MMIRSLLWIMAPMALSVGVIWLSAQDKPPMAPEGIKVADMSERLQVREKNAVQKEKQLMELEQRLITLQSNLDKDRMNIQEREKSLQDAIAKYEAERSRPTLDPQLPRTYESMDPISSAKALKELAHKNQEVAVSLLASMQAKKAAKLLDQLALMDAPLTGKLSERVGMTKPKEQ